MQKWEVLPAFQEDMKSSETWPDLSGKIDKNALMDKICLGKVGMHHKPQLNSSVK